MCTVTELLEERQSCREIDKQQECAVTTAVSIAVQSTSAK